MNIITKILDIIAPTRNMSNIEIIKYNYKQEILKHKISEPRAYQLIIEMPREGYEQGGDEEQCISHHPLYSYLYALNSNKRFILGESTIAQNEYYSKRYAEDILGMTEENVINP